MSQDDHTDHVDFTDFTNDDRYDREVERMKIKIKNRRVVTLRYLKKIEEKLSSEMAEIKSKINQVRSDFDENGQRLVDAFQSRSAEYENRLKRESEKLNKLYGEFGNYKTSLDEFYGGSEKLNKLYEEFGNYKTSFDEFYGDEFRKFQAEKQNFTALLVELRMDMLGTVDDHIKEVNVNIKRMKKVYEDTMAFVKIHVSVPEDERRQDPTTTTTSTSTS